VGRSSVQQRQRIVQRADDRHHLDRHGRRRRRSDPHCASARRKNDRRIAADRDHLRHARRGDQDRRNRRSVAAHRDPECHSPIVHRYVTNSRNNVLDSRSWVLFMSEESRAEKFLELFNKGKEFTEELLKENQRLRYRLAASETEGASREEVDRLRAEVQQLTEENRRIATRFREVEEENKDFANRYIEIEEQNNNLANLYVASYQLHSTLDFREVIQIVQEIVINLIGAESFAILLLDEK